MQVTNMKLEKIISMVGGDGEFSYQRMGVLQAYAIMRLQPLMAEAVRQISLPEQGPLHIADFGCSREKLHKLHKFHCEVRRRQVR